MMTEEEALNRHSRTSVMSAMYMLEDHHFESITHNGMLYARHQTKEENKEDFRFVCVVHKGEVKTRPVMIWMGY